MRQIQHPAVRKIVEGRAVRYGEAPRFQSFPHQKMEEIKYVEINVLGTITITHQRSTDV